MIMARTLVLSWLALAATAAIGCLVVIAYSHSVEGSPVFSVGAGMQLKVMPGLESFAFVTALAALLVLIRKKAYAVAAVWALVFAATLVGGALLVASTLHASPNVVQWSLLMIIDIAAGALFAVAFGWALPKWRDARRKSSAVPHA